MNFGHGKGYSRPESLVKRRSMKFAICLLHLLCVCVLGLHEEPMLKAGSVDVVTDNDSVRINPVKACLDRARVVEARIIATG